MGFAFKRSREDKKKAAVAAALATQSNSHNHNHNYNHHNHNHNHGHSHGHGHSPSGGSMSEQTVGSGSVDTTEHHSYVVICVDMCDLWILLCMPKRSNAQCSNCLYCDCENQYRKWANHECRIHTGTTIDRMQIQTPMPMPMSMLFPIHTFTQHNSGTAWRQKLSARSNCLRSSCPNARRRLPTDWPTVTTSTTRTWNAQWNGQMLKCQMLNWNCSHINMLERKCSNVNA